MEEYSSVSEPQRLALHAAVRRTLGEEEGDTLMALSPPANTDIATRQDVDVLRTEMTGEFAALRAEMKGESAAVRAEMKGEFKAVRAEMKGEFKAVRAEMAGGFEASRAETAAAIERAKNSTLRWTIATIILVQSASTGLLMRMLG